MTEYCSLCEQEEVSNEVCRNCGFDNETNVITDAEKLRIYYRMLKREDHWIKEIYLLKRIQTLMRCSQASIAKLLGISKSIVSQDLSLLSLVEKNPDLQNHRNKSNAFSIAKKGYAISYDYETDLQRYFFENWDKTMFSKQYYIYEKHNMGKYKLGEAGEIDLIAHHKTDPEWLIIEFKKDSSSDKVVGQILRYMGWVINNLAEKPDRVSGAIICGDHDSNISLALKALPDLQAFVYNRVSDDEIQLIPFDEVDVHRAAELLKKLTPEQISKIKRNLL